MRPGDVLALVKERVEQRPSELQRSPLNPLWEGLGSVVPTPDDGVRVLFRFNWEQKAWHNGWTGSRHTSDTPHRVTAYVFEKAGSATDDSLRVLHVAQSDAFVLRCKRRARSPAAAAPAFMAAAHAFMAAAPADCFL